MNNKQKLEKQMVDEYHDKLERTGCLLYALLMALVLTVIGAMFVTNWIINSITK